MKKRFCPDGTNSPSYPIPHVRAFVTKRNKIFISALPHGTLSHENNSTTLGAIFSSGKNPKLNSTSFYIKAIERGLCPDSVEILFT